MDPDTIRILAVEDNPADLRLLKEYLRGMTNAEILHAATLQQAMGLLSTEHFGVILLDLNLPDSAGLKGLEKILKTRTAAPVIVLTGTDDEKTGLQALSLNAQDYLVKGQINSTSLTRSIRYSIERARTEEALRRLNAELEQRVAEQTSDIRAANDLLEQRVAKRTTELEDANENLRRSQVAALNLMHDAVEARRHVEQANRTLLAHNESNKAMLHASDEAEYLDQVCRIVVRDCGHAMVWIGFAGNDENKSIRPIAHAGFEEGYLETLNLTWADTDRGHGPTGTAIRTGKVSVCRNMLTDPLFTPWRAEALKRGYASSIVFPLIADGTTLGAMTVYSREPDPFSTDEVQLLTGLANDLAFGIRTIRLRKAHAKAEEALRESDQRFRLALKNAPVTVAAQDRELRFVWAYNQRTIDPNEVVGKTDRDLFAPEDAERLMALKREAMHTGEERTDSFWIMSNGVKVFLNVYVEPILNEKGEISGVGIATVNLTESKLAEQTIARAKEEWERTFDAVPDLIAVMDKNHRIVRANRAMADRIHLTPVECVGRLCYCSVHGTDAPPHFCPHVQTMSDGQEHIVEIHENCLGGDFFVSTTPLRDENGETVGSVHVARDITERRNAEDKIRNQYALLKSIIESPESPVFSVDSEYRYTSFNKSHSEVMKGLYGVEIELGRSILDYHKEEGDRAGAKSNIDRVLQGDAFTVETWVGIDESSRRYFEISHSPVKDAGGHIVGAAVFASDVTERKKAEEAVRHSEALLRTITDTSPDPIFLKDHDCRMVMANPATLALIGKPPEQVFGKTDAEFYDDPEIGRAILENDRRIMNSGHTEVVEETVESSKGLRTYLSTKAPYVDATGQVVGLVGVARDITEWKDLQNQRERYLARLGVLLRVSGRILAEKSLEGVLQTMADAARELACAKHAASGYRSREGLFEVFAATGADPTHGGPQGAIFTTERGDAFLDLVKDRDTIRLTEEEFRNHPAWTAIPTKHATLRGLLGARLWDKDGQTRGIMVVSDREEGDFTIEDEVLLTELAALASLSVQHIEARTEVEHREREQEAVFAAITDAVLVHDVNGIPVRANPAALRAFGFDITDIDANTIPQRLSIRRLDGNLVPVDDLPSQRAQRGEKMENEMYMFTNAEGLDYIIRASASPLLVEGKQIGAVTVWNDVTERETLLQELSRERSKLRVIFENAPEAIMVSDESGRITMTNPVVDDLYGTTAARQDYRELVAPKVYQADGSEYAPEDLPLLRSAQQGKSLKDVEMVVMTTGGQRRNLLVNSAPIRDAAGIIQGAIAVSQDITPRKQMEHALRKSAEEYRSLMEEASDGILITDETGNIVAVNARLCEMLGRDKNELISLTMQELLPDEDSDEFLFSIKAGTAPQPEILEHRLKRKDGTLVPVQSSVKKLASGRIQSIVRDITKQKEKEKRIMQVMQEEVFEKLLLKLRAFKHGQSGAMNLNRLALFADNFSAIARILASDPPDRRKDLLDRFGIAAEEFNTLVAPELEHIASLMMIAEVGTALAASKDIRPSAESLLSSIEHLKERLYHVLSLAQEDRTGAFAQTYPSLQEDILGTIGKIRFALSDVTAFIEANFTCLVSDLVKATLQKFETSVSTFRVHFDDETQGSKAVVNSSDLGAVLSILIENSVEALGRDAWTGKREGQRVTIRTEAVGHTVRIIVEDNGPGVPDDIRAHLFENGVSEKSPDRGFGLSYAKKCITRYGGRITHDASMKPGARFVIEIPKA